MLSPANQGCRFMAIVLFSTMAFSIALILILSPLVICANTLPTYDELLAHAHIQGLPLPIAIFLIALLLVVCMRQRFFYLIPCSVIEYDPQSGELTLHP